MITLDEAIECAEWCANEAWGECSDEARQMADWLIELKRLHGMAMGHEKETGMDSFERLNDDVIADDNITSAKCMGYLSRMRSLCEGSEGGTIQPYSVTSGWFATLPSDFFGDVLNVGDKVRKWPNDNDVDLYKEDVYYIQALELWEDGWHVNITDEYGDDCDDVWPTELCKYSKPTVEEILRSFASEIDSVDFWGHQFSEVLDKYAGMLLVKEEDE